MGDVLHPALIFAGAIAILLASQFYARWPLPFGLLLAATAASLLAGFGLPLRHFVEGGFGYINLVLALFAGAFFGQALHVSGAADATAAQLSRALGNRRVFVLAAALMLGLRADRSTHARCRRRGSRA